MILSSMQRYAVAKNKELDFSVIYSTGTDHADVLEFVNDFTDRLENCYFPKTFEGWFADRDQRPGSNVFHQLEDRILSARTVFVVFSKGFQEDTWAEYSSDLGHLIQIKSGTTGKIVAIQLGDQNVIPTKFRLYTHIRYPEQYKDIQKDSVLWKMVVKACSFPDKMDAAQALRFIGDSSDFLKANKKKQVSKTVEEELKSVIEKKQHKYQGKYRWNHPADLFPEDFSKYLFEKNESGGNQPHKYNPTEVSDMLRAIRNLDNHREQEVPITIKQSFGNGSEDYLNFWLCRFSTLLQVTYQAMQNVLDDPNARVLWKYYSQKTVDKICGAQNTKKSSQSSTATNDRKRRLETESAIQSRPELPEQGPTQMQEDPSFSLPSAHIVSLNKPVAELTNAESDEDENIKPNERGDNTDLSVSIGQPSLSQDSDLTADAQGSFSFSPNDDQRNGIPGSLPVKQGIPGNLNSPSTDSGYSHSIPETPVDNMPVIVEDTGLPISPTLQSSDNIAEQNKLNTNAISSHENDGEIISAYPEKKKSRSGFSGLAYLGLGLGVLLVSIIIYKKLKS